MTGTMTRRPVAPSGAGAADDVGVDPRIVRRREQVAAQHRRRRRRILALGAGTIVVVAATVVALRSPLLDVERVVVRGTDRPQVVSRATGVSVGDPLVEVDTAQVRRRLLAVPTVASARVHVDWPDRLVVDVTDERPVLVMTARGRGVTPVAVGRGGRVLGAVGSPGLPRRRLAGLPRVQLVAPAPLSATRPGRTLTGGVADVVVVAEQLPATLRGELVDGRLDRGGSLSFELPDGGTVRFGPVEDVPAKLLSVATVLGGRIERRCLDVVDVREPMRPTISRRAGCALPPPTTSTTGSVGGR